MAVLRSPQSNQFDLEVRRRQRNGEGWIGDNYTAGPNYRARINSAIAQARRVGHLH
jgi:hypothetical protein